MRDGQGSRLGGSGPPHPREQARPCLADVLDTLPHIFDLVPATSALSAARTSWGCLLALMRHGRTTAVGDMEWRCPDRARAGGTYLYVVGRARKFTPVLHVLAPRGALLRGLAARASPGSRYLGQLDFAGARFELSQAAALHSAACRAGLRDEDVASEAECRSALARVLQQPALQGTPPLRVVGLRVQPWQLNAAPEMLEAPAVVEHVDKLRLAAADEKKSSRDSPDHAHATTDGQLGVDTSSQLGTAGARAVAELVRRSSTLRTLVVGSDACETGLGAIAEAALTSGTLTKLICPGGGVWTDAINRHGCGTVTQLSIAGGYNPPHLVLPQQNSLEELLLRFAGVGEMASVAVLLQHSTTLRALDGMCCNLSQVEKLVQAISSNPALPLEELYLYNNEISTFGDGVLTAALANTPSLRALNFALTNLGDAAAFSLADALAGNTTLRELDLSDNYIGTAGTARLLRAVGRSNIEEFVMEDNCYKGENMNSVTIGDILSGNPKLHTLRLGGLRDVGSTSSDDDSDNDDPFTGLIHLHGIESFAQGLATHPALRVLSLRGFVYVTGGAVSLARAVRRSTTLRSFVLDTAHITDACGAQLAEALSGNTGLQHLSLADNPDLGGLTAAALHGALRHLPALQMLNLTWCGLPGDPFWKARVRQVGMPCPRIVLIDESGGGPDAQY